MICARRTSPAPGFVERVIRASLCPSSSLNARTRRVIVTSPARTGAPSNAPDLKKSHPTCRIFRLREKQALLYYQIRRLKGNNPFIAQSHAACLKLVEFELRCAHEEVGQVNEH